MKQLNYDALFGRSVGWRYGWGDVATGTFYPLAYRDQDGNPLHGANDYVLEFPKGQQPPARYWRLSLYDLDGFFSDNVIRRYGIGNMADGLLLDADDMLTIHIQHDSPGVFRESNWLPAPEDRFFLLLRMYQPDEILCTGEYALPEVKRISRDTASS